VLRTCEANRQQTSLQDDAITSIAYVFKHIRELYISIEFDKDQDLQEMSELSDVSEMSDSKENIRQFNEERGKKLVHIFGGAQRLERLVLYTHEVSFFFATPLESYFGKQSWPNLRILQLCNFHTDADTLLRLIKRNSSTLKEVTLSQVLFHSAQWPSFFNGLRGLVAEGNLNLETVGLDSGCWWRTGDDSSDWNVVYKETTTLGDEDISASTEAPIPLQLCDAMAKYVLKGGRSPWDDYPELERDAV